jgi:hypothetical protein
MIRTINLTRPQRFGKYDWEKLKWSKDGDVLMENGRYMGVIFDKSDSSVRYCHVEKISGIMNIRAITIDGKISKKFSAGERVISDDDYAKALRVYNNAKVKLEGVVI